MELKDDQSLVLSREEAIELARHFHMYYYRAQRNINWVVKHIDWLTIKSTIPSPNLENRLEWENNRLTKMKAKQDKYREWENLYELLFKNKRIKPNTTTRMVQKDRLQLPSTDEETIYEQLES